MIAWWPSSAELLTKAGSACNSNPEAGFEYLRPFRAEGRLPARGQGGGATTSARSRPAFFRALSCGHSGKRLPDASRSDRNASWTSLARADGALLGAFAAAEPSQVGLPSPWRVPVPSCHGEPEDEPLELAKLKAVPAREPGRVDAEELAPELGLAQVLQQAAGEKLWTIDTIKGPMG